MYSGTAQAVCAAPWVAHTEVVFEEDVVVVVAALVVVVVCMVVIVVDWLAVVDVGGMELELGLAEELDTAGLDDAAELLIDWAAGLLLD